MYFINTYDEYEYCLSRGYNPLVDWRSFTMDVNLRIDIQHSLFGSSNFQYENQRFYDYMWSNKKHFCEETGKPLENYSSVFISHIISRGSDRRMAVDPRNINILSYEKHNRWENPTLRRKMNIYRVNQLITSLLIEDYNVNLKENRKYYV